MENFLLFTKGKVPTRKLPSRIVLRVVDINSVDKATKTDEAVDEAYQTGLKNSQIPTPSNQEIGQLFKKYTALAHEFVLVTEDINEEVQNVFEED